jgi:hypothetical protein
MDIKDILSVESMSVDCIEFLEGLGYSVVDTQLLKRLKRSDEQLSFLEALGVDNWSGYRTLPEREDYDTDEEYESAVEQAYDNY